MGVPTVPSTPPTIPPSATHWQPPQWLAHWQSHDPVPATQEQIERSLTEAQEALRPVDPRTAAALVAQTVAIYGVPANWVQIADFYLEALEDVPADLAILAMRRVRMQKKFFPKPAELREVIADDLAARRTAALRLQHALWRLNNGRAG